MPSSAKLLASPRSNSPQPVRSAATSDEDLLFEEGVDGADLIADTDPEEVRDPWIGDQLVDALGDAAPALIALTRVGVRQEELPRADLYLPKPIVQQRGTSRYLPQPGTMPLRLTGTAVVLTPIGPFQTVRRRSLALTGLRLVL